MKIPVVLASLLGFLIVIAAIFVFAIDDGDDLPEGRFNAGRQSEFSPGSITYFEAQHVYLVRQTDGTFVASYDWEAWAQILYRDGDEAKRGCRVEISDRHESSLEYIWSIHGPVEGLEEIVLAQGCSGAYFDALGRRGFGPAYTDLERFQVIVSDRGDVIINFAERDCEAPSPCLPFM